MCQLGAKKNLPPFAVITVLAKAFTRWEGGEGEGILVPGSSLWLWEAAQSLPQKHLQIRQCCCCYTTSFGGASEAPNPPDTGKSY